MSNHLLLFYTGYGADPDSAPAIANGTFETELRCRHNAMLAHAEAHEVFVEKKKQGKVKGKFGIKIDGVCAMSSSCPKPF